MLQWELEHGPTYDYSLAQLRNGEDVPEEAVSPPAVRRDAEWIWEAWRALRRVCEHGTVPTEWKAWCDLNEVDDHQARVGWQCISALDKVWLRHKAEERENRRESRTGSMNIGDE